MNSLTCAKRMVAGILAIVLSADTARAAGRDTHLAKAQVAL